MAITQISRIQVRRGLQQDLPALAPGELGWSTDQLRLYIGNGANTAPDYSPTTGVTEVLTQYSILNFTNSLSSNVVANSANIAILQSEVAALGGSPLNFSASASSSGTLTSITANNATITYTLTQGTKQRTGSLRLSYVKSAGTASFDEEYDEANGTLDIVFSVSS